MAKKNVPGKEHLQRLNYLYQLATWHTWQPTHSLARLYAQSMHSVSTKTRSSILPSIKRTVCKKCHRIQIPGRTCHVVLSNKDTKKNGSNDRPKSTASHKDILEIHCTCGSIKRFPIGTNRDYTLAYEKPDALEEL
ncbi:hypothetical protein TBLA_0J01970 [Henningerozyma blattae CBS 6284]|uniref:Uncharacterized protein n=1 Tax=Henningerozyma blattae (strain ATCC 34711 / CBS 6284 / DSM 70876 / NBRC 10599 / NRRL Y-10934 / UCD 77-7) TaxID=1071380 RepID=I2H9Y9_HENB6|nr:hypothetical protein TBLA_0J01970 [Tetrapisispora blattae CBS 6284]CCH63191.1 hypothetical protein TBLA_0J01970 [Tetrapisispora blattae CBS 6284]